MYNHMCVNNFPEVAGFHKPSVCPVVGHVVRAGFTPSGAPVQKKCGAPNI